MEDATVSVAFRQRLLNCRLRHVKRDGSVLAEHANFYLMVKEGSAWKVGGIILQDVEYFDQ